MGLTIALGKNSIHKEDLMTLSDLIAEITPNGNFKLARVTIVGPYPTKNFFKDQLSKIKPEAVTLYVDDGWPEEQVSAIDFYVRRYAKFDYKCHRVSYGNGNETVTKGLVHAKIYLFEWVNEGNKHRRQCLVIGSNNASQAGFGRNAEALVAIDLSGATGSDCQQKVLGYFDNLDCNSTCDQMKVEFKKGPVVLLPALRITKEKKISGFDAWLRRGRLCHKYAQDASFGRLPIRLKRPFPVADVESIFASYQFGKVGDSTVLARPYVDYTESVELSENTVSKKWKGQFFIETDYGFWTSSECFEELSGIFVDSASESRRIALEWIASAGDAERQLWVDEYISALNGILSQLRAQDEPAETYLQMNEDWLDETYYRKLAVDKLMVDKNRSCDDDFRNRFISGFSFPSVPHIEDGFDSFAENFCITILLKALQKRPISKLAMAVRDALGSEIGGVLTGCDLLAELRNRWPDIAPQLMGFYQKKQKS